MKEWEDILCHHGIEGQKWGERRYQNPDGSLTPAGRERYGVGQRIKRSVRKGLIKAGRIMVKPMVRSMKNKRSRDAQDAALIAATVGVSIPVALTTKAMTVPFAMIASGAGATAAVAGQRIAESLINKKGSQKAKDIKRKDKKQEKQSRQTKLNEKYGEKAAQLERELPGSIKKKYEEAFGTGAQGYENMAYALDEYGFKSYDAKSVEKWLKDYWDGE